MENGGSRVQVCGPLVVELSGRRLEDRLPGRQGGLVVAYLALSRARPVTRDELADLMWPADPPADPPEALSALLSKVRRALGREALEGRRELRLALPPGAVVDWEVAAGATARAREHAAAGDWRAAWEQAGAALDVTDRGFLAGHDGPWVDERRAELEELRLGALETAAAAGVALGDPEVAGAERAARALVAGAPFRESGHRLLMESLAARGNVAEALRVYEDLRVLLREELGTAPAPEVQEAHARLLAGEGRRAPAAAAPAAQERVPLPSQLSPRERSAFVGRERELGVLRTAWHDARAGHRRLVLVAGEAGIGKTRLTSELAREAHDEGTVLYAGCQEDALVAYQPFVEALRHYARGARFDPAGLHLGAGADELARLIPELAGTLPAEPAAPSVDPETRRYLMFEAVSALLSEAAKRAPLVLVLDDLHWADHSTVHLLRHLVRSSQDAPLLIVGTYRDGEVGADHPLGRLLADLRRERLFVRVALEGLDAGGVEELIQTHAGHDPSADLVGTIHGRTAGNPFFVEEVLRHLIETDALGTPADLGVPEGVKEVLGRRLARLSEACRVALSDAAVLGAAFSFEVLLAMAETGEDALIAALEEAVGAQLVVEAAGSPAPAYAFTHALVREALYAGLSGPRRQRMHARAASAIERTAGEAEVAALALHHRQAGTAGDAERAIDFSLRAGAQASAVSAWEEAVAHWDGAQAVMARAGGREPERARLLVALADLMVVAGDLGRQIAYLEQALALYEELGDDVRAAQVHSRLGMAHSLIDSIFGEHLDIGRAFRHFDAARDVLGRWSEGKALGHLETGVATSLSYGLRVPEGIEAAARGMEIAARLGDDLLWASAAQAYGWHKIVAGELRDGLATIERAFAVADREQRSFLAWMGTNIEGQLTWGLGAPDEAQAFFERPLPYSGKTAYRQQIADGIGRCHASRGEFAEARRLLSDAKPTWITHSLKPLVDLWDGEWDEVAALAGRVLETSRRTRNRWDEWASCHLAARVLHLRGQLDAAGELLEQALAIVVDGGAAYFEMWVLPDLARVRAEEGRLGEARAHAERCREIVAGGEDWRGRGGHAALAEAVVLGHEGRMDEAGARFAAAHETLARLRLLPDEADALHQWGLALARAGDAAAAAERLDRARELYRRHGAGAPWLSRTAGSRAR